LRVEKSAKTRFFGSPFTSAASIETRSRPRLLAATRHGFKVDHSHCLALAPATLAALPSTRAIPDRGVFYVADPVNSIHEHGSQKGRRKKEEVTKSNK
jgi:hypothetical protein